MLMTAIVLAFVTLVGWRPCGAAQDATPVLDVRAKEGRVPLTFYAIGFSRSGRFAWLERRSGFDDDQFEWSLHVKDLARNRRIGERSFSTSRRGLETFCGKYGRSIAGILDKYEIEAASPPRFEPPGATGDPAAVDLRPGRRDPESGKTRYEVLLRGRAGGKRLGSVWRVDEESGEPPVGAPKLLGTVRSPHGPRVAVLIMQEMIGTEGAQVTLVEVFGGRLDGD
jgi:hypothetical protein